jgi:exosortase C (VPDSG-CTERM-specific)
VNELRTKTGALDREEASRTPAALKGIGGISRWRNPDLRQRERLLGCLGCTALLTVAFIKPLLSLVVHSATSDLHSHILLVPFISAYLIRLQRKQLPREYISSPGLAMVFLVAGLAALASAWGLRESGWPLSHNDFLALMALSFVCLLAVAGFLFLGRKWMAAAAFPVAFLIFIVPMPDGAAQWLETASKLASTEVANLFFSISGVPVLRDGTVFQLPGILFEVGQECSGIRSSWVLFMISLLAAHLFLQSPWRRTVLVALVIPLGILRNGFRILVIGLLCVHEGPQMMHSFIHKQGGPVFFVLALIPLFLLLWWLRKGEIGARSPGSRLKIARAEDCDS